MSLSSLSPLSFGASALSPSEFLGVRSMTRSRRVQSLVCEYNFMGEYRYFMLGEYASVLWVLDLLGVYCVSFGCIGHVLHLGVCIFVLY